MSERNLFKAWTLNMIWEYLTIHEEDGLVPKQINLNIFYIKSIKTLTYRLYRHCSITIHYSYIQTPSWKLCISVFIESVQISLNRDKIKCSVYSVLHFATFPHLETLQDGKDSPSRIYPWNNKRLFSVYLLFHIGFTVY